MKRIYDLMTVYTLIKDGKVIDQTANEQEAMEAFKACPTATVHKANVDVRSASYIARWEVEIDEAGAE